MSNEVNVIGYNIMRNAIQLVETSVTEMHTAKRFVEADKQLMAGFVQDAHISSQILELQYPENANRYIDGFLKIKISLVDLASKALPKLTLSVVVKGKFEMQDKEISDIEFFRMVDGLCVPLLMPHAKVYLDMLKIMVDVPFMSLPTIDILNSMNGNKIYSDIVN